MNDQNTNTKITNNQYYFAAAVRPSRYGTIKDLGEEDTVIATSTTTATSSGTKTAAEYLQLGSTALSEEQHAQAIAWYEQGLSSVVLASSHTTSTPLTPTSFLVRLSLETNLATAYSVLGDETKAIQHYEEAIAIYTNKHQRIDASQIELIEEATAITSQAAFFYGMELQGQIIEEDENDSDTNTNTGSNTAQEAIDAYAYAVQLDPNLWAAYANLGRYY